MIEPIQRASTARFDPGPEFLVLLMFEFDTSFAGGGNAVFFALGRANRFRQTDGQLLEVFERRRGFGAGVGIWVEDLLGITVEVYKRYDGDVIVYRFVAGPVGEATRLNGLEGTFACETFGTRVVGCAAVVVPLEGVSMVKIDASAEAEGCLLSVLAPQTVGFPGVDVAVGVHGGDKDPIEFFEEAGYFLGFTVGGDEGVGDVVDSTGADPLAGMGAAGYDDCFTGG